MLKINLNFDRLNYEVTSRLYPRLSFAIYKTVDIHYASGALIAASAVALAVRWFMYKHLEKSARYHLCDWGHLRHPDHRFP